MAARAPLTPLLTPAPALGRLARPPALPRSFDSVWEADMHALARLPNVYAKLSGLPQAYGKTGWTAADFEPYIRSALSAFGAVRTLRPRRPAVRPRQGEAVGGRGGALGHSRSSPPRLTRVCVLPNPR